MRTLKFWASVSQRFRTKPSPNPMLSARYPKTIMCGVCRTIQPIKGSAGGGPNRSKRVCAGCRPKFDPDMRTDCLLLSESGMSYRKIAALMRNSGRKPHPSEDQVYRWTSQLKGESA